MTTLIVTLLWAAVLISLLRCRSAKTVPETFGWSIAAVFYAWLAYLYTQNPF